MSAPTDLRGGFDGPVVQERWPGRYCDACRASGAPEPKRATHARDSHGGGRDFYCDVHSPPRPPPPPEARAKRRCTCAMPTYYYSPEGAKGHCTCGALA